MLSSFDTVQAGKRLLMLDAGIARTAGFDGLR
jgi:hypothetical protein